MGTSLHKPGRLHQSAIACPAGSISCYCCQARDRSLFHGVGDEALAEIGLQRHWKRFAAGAHLYMEGETPRCVYCVRDGKVKLYRSLPDGRNAILGISGSGDLLGVRPLLLGRDHDLGAQALEATTACLLDRDTFVSVLGRHSGLSLRLAMRLSNDLHEAYQQLVGATMKTPADRVREVLVSLTESHGRHAPDGDRIASGLSQDELAALAGMSRRTLSRAMAQLRQEGFVQCTRRTILVRGNIGGAGGRSS